MTARLTAYHAAYLLDEGIPCDAELMNAKVRNVENLLEAINISMAIHGAPGLDRRRHMDRLWSDGQAMRPPAGTTEIQHRRLAEIAAGVGKTPWSARLREAATAGQNV